MVNSYNRRGISTIVGGVIFLVLLTSGFSAFYIALDVQKDTINTQRDISKNIVEKTLEQFAISAASNPVDNKLGIQVKNQGTNPVEITNIWIINKSSIETPPYNATSYDIDYEDAFIPSGFSSAILENTPLYLIPNDYTIKVVSSLGSIKQTDLTVGGPNNLLAELFTIPPDVRQGENVTVALRVTNVGDTQLVDVRPHYIPPDVKPLVEISASQFVSTSPVPTLNPAESAIFTWHYKVKTDATVGIRVIFTSAANATDSATGFDILSNNATDAIFVRDPQGGSGEEIVIKDELFGKPAVFMLVPNTFGTNEAEGLWGVTVGNPTDALMEVTKVSITALYATANTNQEIFTASDDHTNIQPQPDDFWSIPNDNQLIWYDPGGYTQSIPGRSAFTFLVSADPGKVSSGTGLDSVVIHASVFTTLGAFGEASWNTSMQKTTEAIANVYLYDGVSTPYTDTSKIQSSRMGIPSSSPQTFHIILAERGGVNILPGAQLIINIPQDWIVNEPSITDDGFGGTAFLTPFPDGSSQIVGILSSVLNTDAKRISFEAVAPSVACDKMYVMHVLANGKTVGNFPIGPLAEIVLQVNPLGVCP